MQNSEDVRNLLVPIVVAPTPVPVTAPLSPSQDTTSDQVAAFYRPHPIPFVRHSPLPTAGQASVGATSKSVSQTQSGRTAYGQVRNLNQIPSSTVNSGTIAPIAAQISNLTTAYLCSTTASSLGSGGSVTNPKNAIDGDLSTFADIVDSISSPGTAATSLTVSGFPGVRAVTPAVLNVLSSADFTNGVPLLTVAYSLNGGTSFTNIYSVFVNRSLQTDVVNLPLNQNLALVQVKATAQTTNSGGSTSAEIKLYEAWISLAVSS